MLHGYQQTYGTNSASNVLQGAMPEPDGPNPVTREVIDGAFEDALTLSMRIRDLADFLDGLPSDMAGKADNGLTPGLTPGGALNELAERASITTRSIRLGHHAIDRILAHFGR